VGVLLVSVDIIWVRVCRWTGSGDGRLFIGHTCL